eukprot:307447_1
MAFIITCILSIVSTSAINWIHPGSLDSIEELNFVSKQIKNEQQPWFDWFNIAKNSGYATRTPNAISIFDANDNNNAGKAENDAEAAYIQALLWYYTNNTIYAERSITILNAWSILQNITANNEQNMLVAGWIGADFGAAAEIMRLYTNWSSNDISSFQIMLKRVFYPLLTPMSDWNGNVDLTQIDAIMSIAVFMEDINFFNLGISRLNTRLPSYIYLISDGPPSNNVPPPINGNGGNNQNFWYNPLKWIDGLMQETCRDNGHHTQFGLGSAIHALQVAYHQHNDLYSLHQNRITAALELLSLQLRTGDMQGTCSNNKATNDKYDTFEIGYSYYYYIKNVTLQNTNLLLVDYIRVMNGNSPKYTQYSVLNIVMETMTHANINLNNYNI